MLITIFCKSLRLHIRTIRNANRRRSSRALLPLESLEPRQLLASSITLSSQTGVLAIVGTPGNDLAHVDYGETTTTIGGVTSTVPDLSRILVRLQSDTPGSDLQAAYSAAAVKSVKFDAQGGTDLLSNKTTKVSSWTTTTGGLVNTSLMVGSPGYSAPEGIGEVGVFNVGPTGQVGVDYLFRGAGYNGQLAIYSLDGMDAYKPGSYEYIHEAARRALSETNQGHVVIKAEKEGARFTASLPWEGNMNKGAYAGVRTVSMNPGGRFAAMLVPNGTVQTVFKSLTYATSLRPLFSVPAANPYAVSPQYLGQVGDLDGHGSLFAFEDLRLDGSSDRDYNDMVFQITGARGKATPVSEVTNASRNLSKTPLFRDMQAYTTTQQQNDIVGQLAGYKQGGFEVSPNGSVGVNYLKDGTPLQGEVAIFSLEGMGSLIPGTREFAVEAARRALTDSTLGHVVISDSFETPQGGKVYQGIDSYAMTPGDTFGVISVANGTVWGLFSGAVKATDPGVVMSLKNADGSGGAMITSINAPINTSWAVDLAGTSIAITNAIANPTVTLAPASFDGQAYLDLDGNGKADPADPSLPGIVVTIVGSDLAGNPVNRSVITTTNGCFDFENLPAGIYRVSGEDPSGRTLSGGSQIGTNGGLALAGSLSGITILPGQHADNYALGRIEPARFRGWVYADQNGDRIFDGSEVGIGKVVVSLAGTNDFGQPVSLVTATAADGSYRFEGLRPGVYQIQETQPVGWLDGRESIGTFLGLASPIARNGTVGGDIFRGIAIRPGEEGYNYNFAETDSVSSPVSYKVETAYAGTEQDDVVEIILGVNTHQIHINDMWDLIDASVSTLLTFDGLGGNDRVSIVGLPGSEAMTIAPWNSTLIAPGVRLEINGAAGVTFKGGLGDRAFVYDTAGDDVYKATPTFRELSGQGYLATVAGVERVYVYGTAGGNDTAVLSDSAGDDTFKATPGDARLYGDNYYNYVRGFDRYEAVAGSGGVDRAYLYDSAGNDTLVSDPSVSRLYGTGFDLTARGFARVDAYANSGGFDTARLTGSIGDDRFYGGPIEGQMIGTGYDIHAIGFDKVAGSGSSGGADRAYLTGTQADDTLTGSSLQARLVGPGLDVTAEAFPWAIVSGGGCLGTDTATLTDSLGNDTFEAGAVAGTTRMYGSAYSLRVDNFAKVTARSSLGGVDKATLKDSVGDDLLEARPGAARLSGRGFDNNAIGFAIIDTDASLGGNDRAILTDSAGDDLLTAAGSTLSLVTTGYTLRLNAFEVVKVTATTGKNRKKLSTIDYALELVNTWVV